MQVIFYLIGASFIMLAIGLKICSKIKKYRYFNGKQYIDAKEKLLDFAKEFGELLSLCSYIPDEKRDEIHKRCDSSVSFFDKKPYALPEDVMESLEKYAHIDEYISKHRMEVGFELDFSTPLRVLLDEKSYVSKKQISILLEKSSAVVDLLKKEKCFFLNGTLDGIINYANMEDICKENNKRFVNCELESCRDFFDSITQYPLDEQQRKCCVLDEDSTLVIAGAGSGKTSVIMAKVAYLIEKRNVDPSSILLISFTNKAADEMTERIRRCIGPCGVEALTFHKFGLQILKDFYKKRYDIADDEFLIKCIRNSLGGEGKVVDVDYVQKVVKYFAYYFNPDQSQKKYKSLGERFDSERTLNLETLKVMTATQNDSITLSGEHVKSLEEAFIANFLFLNGIEYQYEAKYSKEYDDGEHRHYHPDFYLPKYGIYIEHYGVDEKGMPPSFFSEADKKKYIASMQWKRKLHKEHANKYIESYSWWNVKNELFSKLENELRKFNVEFKPRNVKEIWQKLCANAKGQVTEFERLISAFISLFKSNGFNDDYFRELLSLKADTPHNTERQRTFLEIVRRIYNDYQKELEIGTVYDFSDMINKATEVVQGLSNESLSYKYIIVDEYQDASIGRMRLLKAVIDKTNAHLFCVGDDWQSIFRFAGSDINLFTNFSKYFGESAELKLEKTYRNSQELIDVMGQFVMRNPEQIQKTLQSNLHNKYPVCLIIYPVEKNKSSAIDGLGTALDAVVKSIVKNATPRAEAKTNVLLLGRTKYDEMLITHSASLRRKGTSGYYEVIDNPKITCQFLTVHKAKGLEGDYVILLNAKNDLLGFPNLIADDPLLQLVLSKAESYDYAEERRLLYVALTRTRNKVYLLVPEKSYSPFVDELIELGVEAKHFIGGVATKDNIDCPKCRKGRLIVRKGQNGEFMTCSNFPRCDYRIKGKYNSSSKRCIVCGNFMILRHSNKQYDGERMNRYPNNRFWGCANYPHCKYTESI
jgi:DNA helicase-4